MLFRFISTLMLLAFCGTAFPQQTQSPGLELNLEKFPEQSENEENGELQLDLKKFDQQQQPKDLELNLEQFDDKAHTNRVESTNSQETNSQNETANTDLKVNLEQFEEEATPRPNESNLDVNPGAASVDKPAGKINTTGSAARKIGDSGNTEMDDDMYLLKAGFWFLVGALVVFLLIRARIRKRRRNRPPGTVQRSPSYDERNHR